MELIWDGIREAFRLIFTGDAEGYEITLLSLTVSGAATPIALVIGLSIASLIAFRPPPAPRVGPRAVVPPPVVTALSVVPPQTLHPKLRLQVLALGASRWQAAWLLFREARLPLLAAVMAGFGPARSGGGASIKVGGNIKGS